MQKRATHFFFSYQISPHHVRPDFMMHAKSRRPKFYYNQYAKLNSLRANIGMSSMGFKQRELLTFIIITIESYVNYTGILKQNIGLSAVLESMFRIRSG